MAYIDFAAVKERVSFGETIRLLGLNLKQNNNQWRGSCPRCNAGGDRALVVTNGKGFFCFASKAGGDQIALVAHIRDIPVKDAAAFLGGNSTSPEAREEPRNSTSDRNSTSCPVLTYLEATDERVQKLGVTAETAEEWESGFASKGVLRGFYAVPVKAGNGTLQAYVGIAVDKDQPSLHFFQGFDPKTGIFGAHRITEGSLTLLRKPLDVLMAYQSGAENCICFLTDMLYPEQLEALAILMQEKGCSSLELF